MTYFPDLSPHRRTPESGDQPTINIGWLDISVPYPQGETSPAFHERLEQFCAEEATVHHCFGLHLCQFCERSLAAVGPKPKSRAIAAGNGEIRVIGKSVIYAAPSLIYHYVTEHQYKPPDEFIEAVLAGPGPASEEHRRLVARCAPQGA